jgi:hypothetical protein
MQHDRDHDLCRHALPRQVLDECESQRVWQQFGAAYIARPVRGRLMPAPKHWRRIVAALMKTRVPARLGFQLGFIVELLPESNCLLVPACIRVASIR